MWIHSEKYNGYIEPNVFLNFKIAWKFVLRGKQNSFFFHLEFSNMAYFSQSLSMKIPVGSIQTPKKFGGDNFQGGSMK